MFFCLPGLLSQGPVYSGIIRRKRTCLFDTSLDTLLKQEGPLRVVTLFFLRIFTGVETVVPNITK